MAWKGFLCAFLKNLARSLAMKLLESIAISGQSNWVSFDSRVAVLGFLKKMPSLCWLPSLSK